MTQPLPLRDRFSSPLTWGDVVDSRADSGHRRHGVDRQDTLATADGLRIRPLIEPGWDRSGVAYGPFAAADGLALSVVVHHGHPASEADDPWPPLHQYVAQWWRGTQIDAPLTRLRTTWALPTRERLTRRLAAWRGHRGPTGRPDGNFLVGWANAPARSEGCAAGLLVRSSGGDNAQLCLATPGRPAVVDGFPNLPLQVVSVQLCTGTLVLAATLAGAEHLPGFGHLRPLGLVAGAPGPWATLQQSVLGQVGWSVDTVVPAVDLDRVPGHFAPQRSKTVQRYRFGDESLVGGPLPEPAGLLVVDEGLVAALRVADDGSGWLVRRRGGALRLERWANGAAVEVWEAETDTAGTVQVLDDGRELRVLAGDVLAIGPLLHRANASCSAVAATEGGVLRSWPRTLRCPDQLCGPPPEIPEATTVVIDDDFSGGDAPDLDGRAAGDGAVWTRTIGSQAFAVSGAGVVIPPVDGAARPGGKLAALRHGSGVRTAYTVPWRHQSAVLTAEIVPPGTDRHQGHGSRAGLIFAQDDDNALLINLWLDDNYDGTSVSSFFRLGGHEEVFDAVWVNVGRRVTWGRPTELTAACDGDNYLVKVDGRPVLHRAITTVYPKAKPLRLRRVGIVANWEFGQDTGSTIRRFRAHG